MGFFPIGSSGPREADQGAVNWAPPLLFPLGGPTAAQSRGLDKRAGLGMVGDMSEASTAHVLLKTNAGDIKVRLFAEHAPKAVESFTGLVGKGYYNGIIFHRVIPEFMIQGGDPTGTGRGGQSLWGRPFEDECTPQLRFDRKGLLAMANAGPNTNGSQFFITTAATPWLDGRHTIFGEVVEGYETVQSIEGTATRADDRPLQDQTILEALLLS
ncbi:MAG: hypothetical protein RL648_1705 [Verrucomicrobiota bacterium]